MSASIAIGQTIVISYHANKGKGPLKVMLGKVTKFGRRWATASVPTGIPAHPYEHFRFDKTSMEAAPERKGIKFELHATTTTN